MCRYKVSPVWYTTEEPAGIVNAPSCSLSFSDSLRENRSEYIPVCFHLNIGLFVFAARFVRASQLAFVASVQRADRYRQRLRSGITELGNAEKARNGGKPTI